MKNINLKSTLFLLVGVSLLSFFVLARIQEIVCFSFLNVIKLLPKVVSIDLIIIAAFSSFLWKFRIFRGWLVLFPNLNGTWKGNIQTTWIDPKTNLRPDPIPAILTIKQSFFRISCVMRTAEMTSRSFIADFIIDKENQLKRLSYSYDSNPIQTVKERSPQHYGTILFDIVETPKPVMTGEYWTGRKTTGQIKMTFWKRKRIDSYPKELGDHPVSEARNNKE